MADYLKITRLASNREVQKRILTGLDKQAVSVLSTGAPVNRVVWATAVRTDGNYGGPVENIARALFTQYPGAVGLFKEQTGVVHVADEDALASSIDTVLPDFIDDYLAV